jgi:hypothetical protein
MQWNQDLISSWSTSNCRMLQYINFHARSSCEPIAKDFGLHIFKEMFAMRARTQLRPTESMTGAIQVFSDDGFAMSIHEIGTTGADRDVLYSDYKVVKKLAHPQALDCMSFTMDTVTLEKDKIYVLDIKYYQQKGAKCLKVDPLLHSCFFLQICVNSPATLDLHGSSMQ